MLSECIYTASGGGATNINIKYVEPQNYASNPTIDAGFTPSGYLVCGWDGASRFMGLYDDSYDSGYFTQVYGSNVYHVADSSAPTSKGHATISGNNVTPYVQGCTNVQVLIWGYQS